MKNLETVSITELAHVIGGFDISSLTSLFSGATGGATGGGNQQQQKQQGASGGGGGGLGGGGLGGILSSFLGSK